MVEVRQYIAKSGKNAFESWFRGLDAATAARVESTVGRLEDGNFSNVKGVGSGVFEARLDFGPGYRIYFGKKRQQNDIETAITLWKEYKARKFEHGTD